MNDQMVLDFAKQALYTVILTASPLLLIALTVGLLVSIFQTVTSIQEQTLAFVPKILAVFIGVLIFGSFIGNVLLDFFVSTITSINQFIK